MVVQVDDMVRDVRVAIDMNRTDEGLELFEDEETLKLDEIIVSKLAEAVSLVEKEAPAQMLESGHDFGDKNVFIGKDGKGFVILPDDFMRLLCFRMSDWKRSVYEPINETDPQYGLQCSKWKGVCGNTAKPVVAIVRRSEGKVLEFYSSNDDTATVTQATYIPYRKIDEDNSLDVSEDCYRSAVYRAGSLALATIGDQLSGTLLELSRAELQ